MEALGSSYGCTTRPQALGLQPEPPVSISSAPPHRNILGDQCLKIESRTLALTLVRSDVNKARMFWGGARLGSASGHISSASYLRAAVPLFPVLPWMLMLLKEVKVASAHLDGASLTPWF